MRLLGKHNPSATPKSVAAAGLKGAIGGAVPFLVAVCLFSQVRSEWPSYLLEFMAIAASIGALFELYPPWKK
jgi:hypothetical protein